MRLGIDCSCLAKPERTGVARYGLALLEELPGLLEPKDRVVLLYRISRMRRRQWFHRVDDPRFSLAYLNDRLIRIHPDGLDVVHGPDVRIPRIDGVPAVATIHDLSALDVPGIAGENFRRRKAAALGYVAAKASVALCVSSFTEAALLRRYPQIEGRTRVVPQGLSPRFRPEEPGRVYATREARNVRSPYILFVGQVAARKNLKVLVDAFSRLHAAQPGLDLDLVIAGPTHTGGDEVREYARQSPVAERIRFLGWVGETDLPSLYSGAEAFCFASKAEGFGMTLLEAMACGCPVVAARAGANETTAGNAALWIDPDDPESIAAALRRVLPRNGERASLVERGRRRAALFSWRETARRTVEAYRDAIRAGVPQ